MSEQVAQTFARLLEATAAPILALERSAERVYLPYLLGAGLVATLLWWKKLRGKVSLGAFLLPGKIWLHPSALFDLRYMVGRALFEALLLGPVVITSAHGATWLRLYLSDAYDVGWQLPPPLALVLLSIGAFLGEDAARYWIHRLSHRIPALWELHKLHHSAEVLTPFTIYRTHPIEGLLMRSGAALGLGITAGVCAWLLGAPLSVWEVLGVHGLSLAWNVTGSNLRHSHVWVRYPAWLERVLISPAQHQIHHSNQETHFDRNYGSVFALWDWMFSSLYVPEKREVLTFGLAPGEKNHRDTVLSGLVSPARAALARLFRLKDVRAS